ncbi:keratin-associated protein 13-1-like [Apodemus sylvaticus]|uniref:keratin-associated protein 13-1-like n=1 Tax=Apodemus sylvaticus TaxID=10129 RepID=UPI002244DD66|nr:keratin-associated protein 13-1-like [Apodemus sylvaticus]
MTCDCCSRNVPPSLRCCCPPQEPAVALPAPAIWSTALPAAAPSTCQLDSSLHSGCQETCIEPVSCSPSTCQLGSSLNSGCQETCMEPTSCQTSCVVPSPCQIPCFYPRRSTPFSPCQGTYDGSLGFGSSNYHSLGYRSRIIFPENCGSSGFRNMNYEVPVFPSLGCAATLCFPIYMLFNSNQPSLCVPTCDPCLSVISC